MLIQFMILAKIIMESYSKTLKMSFYIFERIVFITPDDKRVLPRVLPKRHDN